ncbi:MAG: hypothetical protein JO301_07970 [Chitinophagaceae bacterium]|nr:hypothetical protein [Chitinophagaceae bacterium]
MKMIKTIACFTVLAFFSSAINAQAYNWESLKENQNLINVQAGFDYGVVAGVGYGYRIKSKIPMVLHGDYSFPAGKNLLDDFKTRVGATARLYDAGGLQVSADITGVFRRNENDMVRMVNFGSEMKAVAGYYRSGWLVAAEIGFDKAIVTHLKHSAVYKTSYPGVTDGWYIPTGGNFLYGVQGGFSFRKTDLYLKAGKTVMQDFKTTPLLPYYFEFGINRKF